MTFTPTQTEPVNIRPAMPFEQRACRLLLQGLASHPTTGALRVAESGSRLVGAAALTGPADVDGKIPFDVEVIEPFRRRGVARSLLSALGSVARRAGATSLKTQLWVDDSTAPAQAMRRLGFTPQRRRYEYTAYGPAVLAGLEPLCRSVEGKDKIPAGAKVLPVSEVDKDRVADLFFRVFGTSAEPIRRSLLGQAATEADDIDLQLSPAVVLGDGRVIGFVLGRSLFESRVFECDWQAVDPEFRRGWANVWMMYHAVKMGLETTGLTHVRYRTFEENHNMRRLFTHINGSTLGSSVIYGRSIDADSASATA